MAELAYHFGRSGDRERGAAWARRAAEHALSSAAPREAMHHYRAALDLAPEDDPERGELLLSLGNAALLADDDGAIETFASAETWFRGRQQWLAAARASQRRGEALWRRERNLEARSAFEAALTLYGQDAPQERIRTLIDLSSLAQQRLPRPRRGDRASQRSGGGSESKRGPSVAGLGNPSARQPHGAPGATG